MKKIKQQIAPEFTIDADGQELVHVALANSQQRATLYAEDYRRLISAGFSAFWQYTEDGRGGAYPTLYAYTPAGKSYIVPVARLVANAGHGERIRYNEGNALNLRMENLSFTPGYAWHAASDWFPNTAALREAGIEPVKRERTSKRERQHTPIGIPQNPQASLNGQRAKGSTQNAPGARPVPARTCAGVERAYV